MDQATVNSITTLQRNLTNLLSIADKKAGVLMGANFLVISILISQIAVKGFILVLCVPLLFSLYLIFLSMRVLSPKFYESQSLDTNLFFFGHIAAMNQQQYAEQMLEAIKDDEKLLQVLLNDCYQVSRILEIKHNLLRYCFYATYLFIVSVGCTIITVYLVRGIELV